MAWRIAAAALLALGACAQYGAAPLPPIDARIEPVDLEFDRVAASYNRAYERSFTEQPFGLGSMAVIAEENGELSTWNFFPCGGSAICSGSPRGAAGQLGRTPDWWVVTGLHGRTFWLSYGGDGYVERNGHYVPLAWNARPNGTGDGTDPAVETPYPHGVEPGRETLR